jgi:molybdopterin converting factor subunit 1
MKSRIGRLDTTPLQHVSTAGPEFLMTIVVKLFAILRDKAGIAQTTLELPAESCVSDAIKMLSTVYPSMIDFLPRVACAVNEHYMPRTTQLNDGDELALIPPVSGG